MLVTAWQSPLVDYGALLLIAPLIFSNPRQICRKISAYAWSCRPQRIHNTLLSRNSQKPQFLLNFLCAATNHAATTVTTIAGH